MNRPAAAPSAQSHAAMLDDAPASDSNLVEVTTGHRFSRRRTHYIVDRLYQRRIVHNVLRLVTAGIALAAVNLLIIDYYAGFLRETFGEIVNASPAVLVSTSLYLLLWVVLSYLTLHIFLVVFSHRIAGPEHKIRSILAGIRKGDLDFKVTLRKKDYLQDLASDLNLTGISLRESANELETELRALREALGRDDAVEVERAMAAMESRMRRFRRRDDAIDEPAPLTPSADKAA